MHELLHRNSFGRQPEKRDNINNGYTFNRLTDTMSATESTLTYLHSKNERLVGKTHKNASYFALFQSLGFQFKYTDSKKG